MSRPNRLVLSLTVVVCLSLTACQDDSEPSGAPPPSRSSSPSAATPTPALDAAAVRFLERVRHGTAKQGTVHIDLTIRGKAPRRSAYDLQYDARATRLRETTWLAALGSRPQVTIVLPTSAYVSIPGVTARGKFFRVRPGDPGFARYAAGSAGLSPDRSVRTLQAGLVSVEQLGRQRLRGALTTRYLVTADPTRALDTQGAGQSDGTGLVSYQVWLDGHDRLCRLAVVQQGARLQMDMSRWGEPVDIAAPPRSDVVATPPGF